MLDYAHQRAQEVLKIPQTAILATHGPAGLRLSECPCESAGLALYLLLPQTSDHLFNLEHHAEVTLLTALWELSGRAESASPAGVSLDRLRPADQPWSVLVRVVPTRIHILRAQGWGNTETIDLSGVK